MFRLVTPGQYRRMPWKNGGGVTEEIATHPNGAGFEAFVWRVSIAEVERDGPFSRFPGIDRTITLLEGAGMRLVRADGERVMGVPFEQYSFEGDEAVDCTLLDGPVRDFNVMTRRDRATASVVVVRESATLDAADFTVAFAAAGAHECEARGDPPMRLSPRHTLIVDRSSEVARRALAIRPQEPGAVVLAVRIECR